MMKNHPKLRKRRKDSFFYWLVATG